MFGVDLVPRTSFNHRSTISNSKIVIVVVVSDLLLSYFELFNDYLVIAMPGEGTTRSKE